MSLTDWLKPLRQTILHPQWIAFRTDRSLARELHALARGLVIDIGCADGSRRRFLPAGCRYYGLDYPMTAANWYGTTPDIYGDAQRLPLRDASADTVLLLDVMEHLPNPDRALAEITRVLAADGRFLLQVPFLYPVHDAPLDFARWTEHGLSRAVQEHGLQIVSLQPLGQPGETAAMLLNLAAARACLDWIRRRNPLALLTLLLPLLVPACNLLGWLAGRLAPHSTFMPHSYRLVLRKCTSSS